jgi:hypothetical protein
MKHPEPARYLVLLLAVMAFGVHEAAGQTPAPDTSNQCSPNGTACTHTSHDYTNGTPGMCVNGTCTFCEGAACSAVCMGLQRQAQPACQQAVIKAQIGASERQQIAKKEKHELLGILNRLVLEVETADCSPGEDKMATHCGQHWVRGLSDTDLNGAVALVQNQVDRVKAISTDLAVPMDPSITNQVMQTTDAVTKEKTCRVTPQCMTDRQAKALRDDMCADLAEIRSMQERIRIEKANPSGVVDLKSLHDDGETIQRDQADLKSKGADYLKLTHKPFIQAMCK